MSVTDVGLLHNRYVRLTDRFKSIWTYHQFAAGVFKNFVEAPVPYNIDFRRMYDRVKAISSTLNGAQMERAASEIAVSDLALDHATTHLVRADALIGPSLVRRFFEKLKRQDDAIIQFLIKFYLYADAVEGDCRDKVDFLFTRIGEDFIAERGEYWSRDSLEFRERIIALVSIMRRGEAQEDEVVRLIRAIRSMRDEIHEASAFEELTDRNLLRNARVFKHRLGDLYFHPDVLLAIVELNVSTKNRFLKLYAEEEQHILEDSQKLMDHGDAITSNFGGTNPELIEEIARFREVKGRFDELRAESNVKHDVMTHLKSSMTSILAKLDAGLAEADEIESTVDLPRTFYAQTEQVENIRSRFSSDIVLQPFLLRIAAAIDAAEDVDEHAVQREALRELRLEPWEMSAYLKLFERQPPDVAEDDDELWLLYLRAAALRIKVDEEATILATTLAAGVDPEGELLTKAKQSLDSAKELDQLFADLLHEAVYYSNPKILHQLYRSRFRLLRGFSGLWLIYDRKSATA
ncbi:MAG: hypothetical protein QOI24_2635 [Acidobacteriota bacterium]|jgi:hypothetical protein|nr:hypothetical protein [Acidobacteriota bacterium]